MAYFQRLLLMTAATATIAMSGGFWIPQSGVQKMGDPNTPVNDLPTPYRTVRTGQLPPSMTKWAAVTAVEAAPDGNIYVVYRCNENSCAGRPEAPILKFDKSGKLLKSWGAGMFIFPHGARWTPGKPLGDRRTRQRRKRATGIQVQSGRQGADDAREGGGRRRGPGLFDQPTDVVVAANGDIFVTEGHCKATIESLNSPRTGNSSRPGARKDRVPASSSRPTPSRSIREAGCSWATGRTIESRSSTRTDNTSTHGNSLAGRADLHRQG